ncbi:MAG: GyrI-like domain-containing protein [Anaerolineales bacterium]|nr:GyrI-like domain-containing protein [Anaerolineales bacterium]
MINITEPKLVERSEQHYVAIRKLVTMAEIGPILPPLSDDVFAWLAEKGIQPSGAVFWRYNVVEMDKKLEIDVAVPIASAVKGDGQIIADVLPAGRYATMLHTGHPSELEEATANLLAWAEKNNIQWKMNGERWGGRVEWYYSGPDTEPDMSKWETELAFLTA